MASITIFITKEVSSKEEGQKEVDKLREWLKQAAESKDEATKLEVTILANYQEMLL